MLFDDLLYNDPRYSLGMAMSYALDEYEQDFDKHWGLSTRTVPEWHEDEQEAWEELVRLHRLAQKIAAGAAALTRPRSLPRTELERLGEIDDNARVLQGQLDEFLEAYKQYSEPESYEFMSEALSGSSLDDPRTRAFFLKNCFEVEAFRYFPADPTDYGRRLKVLAGHLVKAPGQFTSSYLGRVAECYVRGMVVELAVMARAVLDMALQEVLTDEQVVAEVGLRPARGMVNLERRVEAAAAASLLTADALDAAHQIRKQGNDAAHFLPDFDRDSDAILNALSLCLRSLELRRSQP